MWCPGDLHAVRPGPQPPVPAQPEPARLAAPHGHAEPAPDGGVESVGGDEPAGPHACRGDAGGVLPHVGDTGLAPPRAGGLRRRAERGVQFGAPHAQARPGCERRGDVVTAGQVGVGDAGQLHAGRPDAEGREPPDASGHQALAAGLVDRRGAWLAHQHGHAGPRRVHGGRQPGRAAAGDQQVHVVPRRCGALTPRPPTQRGVLHAQPDGEQRPRSPRRRPAPCARRRTPAAGRRLRR